jgi:putative peptide zinc metalloprotease protein
MRGDLICVSRTIDRRLQYVIKDPVRMTYHHYREEDFFLLQCLDGEKSAGAICSEFELKFGQSLGDLHFKYAVEAFVRDQLVAMSIPGQGGVLYRNQKRAFNLVAQNIIRNPIVIKFSGFDMSKVFNSLVPFTKWIVNPLTLIAIVSLIVCAVVLLLFNLTEFQQRLPLASEFFAVRNVFWMMVALAFTKVLHELGHALTCIHFGAECHRVGLMLLVLTPCLYCDVSDAWMIASKWRRIAIASAGILTELTLASICTFLWWYSEPGFLNSLCLNIVFICGVGTVFFNGNPLLKYDGYYMLSDFLEIPNLWKRSRAMLRMKLDSFFWGLPKPDMISMVTKKKFFLVFYAMFSCAYRLIVVVGILLFIVAIMNSFKLFELAVIFSAFVLTGSFVVPAYQSLKRLMQLLKQRKITSFRFGVVSLATVAVAVCVLAIPLPCSISVPAYTEMRDSERIYVSTAGVLVEGCVEGDRVVAGQNIAQLSNMDLSVEAEAVLGRLKQSESRLTSLIALRTLDQSYGTRIPTESEKVQELRDRYAQLQLRLQQLQLKTSRAGVLVAPRSKVSTSNNQFELTFWDGSPIDAKNRNARLEKGTLFCLVGDPLWQEGFALVQQSSIDLIKPGQTTTLQLGGAPHRKISGEVTGISPLEDVELPQDIKALIGSRFTNDLRLNDIEFGKMYLASIQLEKSDMPILNFESATAKIAVAPQSLGARIMRYLNRTFISLSD